MEFTLRKVGNGGWIFSQTVRNGLIPATAAFSNTEDMLRWLAETLYPPHEVPHSDDVGKAPNELA